MLRTYFRFSWIFIIFLVSCDQSERVPPEIKLEPSQTLVDYNGSFVMTWSAEGTDYCIASGDWLGNVKRSGSKTIGPLTKDSEYVLDCYDSGNQISQSVAVKVGKPQIPEIQIAASPLSIAHSGEITLTWSGQNVTDCEAGGDWSGSKEANGSDTIAGLSTDSEFQLVCQGAQGSVSARVKVDVYAPGIDVPYVKITANPLRVPYQGSTTLNWNSSGADICRASGSWGGSKARSGTEIIRQLNQDSQFILTCTKAGRRGVDGRDAIDVRIVNPPPSAR